MLCSVSSRSMFSYTSDAKLTALPTELYWFCEPLLPKECVLLRCILGDRYSTAVEAVVAPPPGEFGYPGLFYIDDCEDWHILTMPQI